MKKDKFFLLVVLIVALLFAMGHYTKPKKIEGNVSSLLRELEVQGKAKRLDYHYTVNIHLSEEQGKMIQTRSNLLTFKNLDFQGQKVWAVMVEFNTHSQADYFTFDNESIARHGGLFWQGSFHPALMIVVFTNSFDFGEQRILLADLIRKMSKKGIIYYSVISSRKGPLW